MSCTDTSKTRTYPKEDIVITGKNGLRKKFFKNRWRRLCSINKCDKQAQRGGLCAKHINRSNQPQRQLINQSSINLIEDENIVLSHSPINRVSDEEDNIESNTLHKDGEN